MKEPMEAQETERQVRTVDHSCVEQVHIILPMDVNASFQLFGGLLMQWIDVVAAVVARRHSGCRVITAAVDHLAFLAPAHLNDVVVLLGRMTYAGRTSMEVCVETFVEQMDQGGTRKLVNRAFVTMVALDKDGKPTFVPKLLPQTDEEKAEYEAAKRRREERKKAEKMHTGE